MSAPAATPDRGAAPDPGIFGDKRETPARGPDLLSGNIPRDERGIRRVHGGVTPPAGADFTAPPPDPALAEDTVPYLPRGVRLAHDRVRGMRVLQAPERAMQLDPVGEAILSALDGRPLGQIIDALAAAYAAPRDQIAGDVTSFLQSLIDRRMVFVRRP